MQQPCALQAQIVLQAKLHAGCATIVQCPRGIDGRADA